MNIISVRKANTLCQKENRVDPALKSWSKVLEGQIIDLACLQRLKRAGQLTGAQIDVSFLEDLAMSLPTQCR